MSRAEKEIKKKCLKIDLTIFGWPHDDSDDNIDDDGMRVREANQNDDLTSLLDVFLIKWARHIGWHLFEIWNSNFYGFFEIFFLVHHTQLAFIMCVSFNNGLHSVLYLLPALFTSAFFLSVCMATATSPSTLLLLLPLSE